jgi:nucleoside-diphosphate-sugar epimerase
MSILVTGSAGHLGEALVRSLRAEGRSAIGVDLKSSPFTDRVGSICDRPFIEGCMKRGSAVIHAATLHKPHVVTHSWQEFSAYARIRISAAHWLGTLEARGIMTGALLKDLIPLHSRIREKSADM